MIITELMYKKLTKITTGGQLSPSIRLHMTNRNYKLFFDVCKRNNLQFYYTLIPIGREKCGLNCLLKSRKPTRILKGNY
jgi:hypothetical protein